MENICDRFLRYVAVNTQSNENSNSQPSAPEELDLLRILRDELQALGLEAELDQWGYVMATLPSNLDREVPAIGFIAHVDTAPDASGEGIRPQIISNYDGSAIELKGVPGLKLDPGEFPELLEHIGETIITTDGTTLLGADDKAGVAEIMAAAEYLLKNEGKLAPGVYDIPEEVDRHVAELKLRAFGGSFDTLNEKQRAYLAGH